MLNNLCSWPLGSYLLFGHVEVFDGTWGSGWVVEAWEVCDEATWSEQGCSDVAQVLMLQSLRVSVGTSGSVRSYDKN